MNEREKHEALGRIAATVIRESFLERMEVLIARDDWGGAAQVAEASGLQWLADDLRKTGNGRK